MPRTRRAGRDGRRAGELARAEVPQRAGRPDDQCGRGGPEQRVAHPAGAAVARAEAVAPGRGLPQPGQDDRERRQEHQDGGRRGPRDDPRHEERGQPELERGHGHRAPLRRAQHPQRRAKRRGIRRLGRAGPRKRRREQEAERRRHAPEYGGPQISRPGPPRGAVPSAPMVEPTVVERSVPDAPAEQGRAPRRPSGWLLAVAGLTLLALVLRLWGIRWGLPFAYNLDERSHFVPRSVEFFRSHSLDPDYQLNPSGLMELVAAALLLTHGSSGSVVRAWQDDPAQVWTVARVAAALVSTAAIPLLYVAGRRLFDRWVGLCAAALLATAFLPVHYGHLALNDAPSLAPTALALVGIAGVLKTGRLREYALAGAGLGIAVGFKYNAAFVVLPLLGAALIVVLRDRRAVPVLLGLLLAGVVAAVAFVL